MAQPTTPTGARPMPAIKTQREFFVTFTSVEGETEEWHPNQNNILGLFTLAKFKRAAIEHTAALIDVRYGRVDWSFVIHEADYVLISDPALYKHGVQEYGYVKGKEVYKFD
jgi:hypothetical protein